MNDLIEKAEAHVRAHVAAHFPATLTYHNIGHIEGVARAATLLADEAKLTPEDREALIVSAWFHDLGMDMGPSGHELRSAELAIAFMAKENQDQALMDRVRALIQATKLVGHANNDLEQLMRDADMAHLASENFPSTIKHLREEREAMSGEPMKKRKWLEENIGFVERTSYGSEAARALWNEGKAKNLAWLKEFVAELNDKKDEQKGSLRSAREEKKEKEVSPSRSASADPGKEGGEAKEAEGSKDGKSGKKGKQKSAERGIETMFRTTLSNHTRLSQIADNKANIMLSVNAIIISVTMSGLLPKLDNHPEYLWPTVSLLFTGVIAIVFATIATIPKTGSGMTTRQQVTRRERNILFFGNFHAMKLSEFDGGIRHLMENPDDLYSSMTWTFSSWGRCCTASTPFCASPTAYS